MQRKWLKRWSWRYKDKGDVGREIYSLREW
jgi:hypothetical protein